MRPMSAHTEIRSTRIETHWAAFLAATVCMILATHAVAFFLHEFSHSFTASALGWKSNPLDLTYGSPSPANLLLQVDIDENVDYDPIFAAGQTTAAGVIAVAGVVLGNGILSLALGLVTFFAAQRKSRVLWAYAGYWLTVMSIGNLLCYVPIRVFSSHADMHTATLGFHCSPATLLVILGLPFLVAAYYFLTIFAPAALRGMFPNSAARRITIIVLTAFVLFGFFGSPGLSNHGEISRTLSLTFIFALVPLAIFLGIYMDRTYQRSGNRTDDIDT